MAWSRLPLGGVVPGGAPGRGRGRRRDLRVFLVDEGKYPSGFAGGKFTRERPDLCMRALVAEERLPVGPARRSSTRSAHRS